MISIYVKITTPIKEIQGLIGCYENDELANTELDKIIESLPMFQTFTIYGEAADNTSTQIVLTSNIIQNSIFEFTFVQTETVQ